MEFGVRPLGFMEFLQNNNHQAVNKMKWIENRKIQSTVGNFTSDCKCVCVCVCVCVCEREREREREKGFVSVSVYECVSAHIPVPPKKRKHT